MLKWICSLVTCCFVGLVTTPSFGEQPKIVFSSDGRTEYQVVLPDEPTPVEQTAADQLVTYLKQVTGANWPIVQCSQADRSQPQIVVGDSSRMRELLPNVDPSQLEYDEIVLATVGQNVVLVGHPQRGTLYAVYTLLEDYIGIRWWTSTESYVPNRPTLKITPPDRRYAPKLIYREAYYLDAFEGVFASRMKCNGSREAIQSEFGGHHRFAYFVHSFYRLIPPEEYFDDHPEWFSLIDGKRCHERAQLCLTNDAMRKELTKNAIQTLRDNPDAKFISISQNDWHGRCQCEKCLAIEEKEGSPSGPLLRFVNLVAEDIQREFPDVWVETLAYQYTRKPPKLVKPRDNVIVRLCSIECSFVEPFVDSLDGEGQNVAFSSDIEGWSRITDRLFIWDYVTNFHGYIVPHPNLKVLGPNIRFFTDHGTIGLFEQGDSYCNVGDFVRLRNWIISHLMWDPTLDDRALIEEFMTGYYGDAAPALLEYLDLINDRAAESGVYMRCFMGDTLKWLDLETIVKADQLFDKALAAVEDDPVLTLRVRRERMPLIHVWLKRYGTLQREARLAGESFVGPVDPGELCSEFMTLADRFKTNAYREYNTMYPFDEYRKDLIDRVQRGRLAAVPEICRDLPDGRWLDYQQYDFNIAQRGKWGEIVDDPKASDGRAVRMPGDHHEWATSCSLGDYLKQQGGRWQCWAAVRAEATANAGPVMTLGIYDWANRKSVAYKQLKIDNESSIVGDEYRLVNLGTYALDGNMYIWAAPPRRPDQVQAVYVDRLFLVRDPGTQP